MQLKLENGKTYQSNTGNVWEILYQTEESVFARAIKVVKNKNTIFNVGEERLFTHSAFNGCTEYKEPVIQKFTHKIGWFSKEQETLFLFNQHLKDVIGDVEFILTDGKLTDVRIV